MGLHVWGCVKLSSPDQHCPCEVRHLGPGVAAELCGRDIQWLCQELQRNYKVKEEKGHICWGQGLVEGVRKKMERKERGLGEVVGHSNQNQSLEGPYGLHSRSWFSLGS